MSVRSALRLYTCAAFLCALLVSGLVSFLILNERYESARHSAADLASSHAHNVRERLERSLSATYELAALVRSGRGRIEQFDELAEQMLKSYGGLSALQLAPGGVVQVSVPLRGNERAIGHDLLADPKRNLEAFLARDTGHLTLAGPFPLLQGGTAVIGRLPVFLPDAEGRNAFWGFVTALIRLEDFGASSGLDRLEQDGYRYRLYRVHPDTGALQTIAASAQLPGDDPVETRVDVPNGKWLLSIAPAVGWSSPMLAASLVVFSIVASGLFGLLAYSVLRQPQQLQREVERRTEQLSESNRQLQAEIEEREAAQAQLGNERARLRALIDSIPDLIVFKNADGAVMGCNKAFEAFFGLSEAQLAGSAGAIPADQEDEARARDEATLSQGRTLLYEQTLRAADGRERHMETLKTPFFGLDGSLLGLIDVRRDITGRKRAEEEIRASNQSLQALLEISQVALNARDLEGTLHRIGPEIHARIGSGIVITELYDSQGGTLACFSCVGVAERCPCGLHHPQRGVSRSAVQTRRPVAQSDVQSCDDELLRPWRELGVHTLLCLPMAADQNVVGALSLAWMQPRALDERLLKMGESLANAVATLVERKRAEERIRELNESLEQRVQQRTADLAAANRELEAFSYSASHDLRTPLRAIEGFAALLAEDCADQLDDCGKDYLGRIRNGAQRMAQLIDDLLDLSRLSRHELKRQPVNLSDMAASIAGELRERNPEREARIEIQPGLVDHVDPVLARVVLTNLLGNAWKFTAERSPAHIAFGAEAHGEPNGPRRTYYVRDNGVGFDMAYVDKLFTPFQRLHPPARYPGTGVGLATVQRIVQRHSGSIGAEGQVDAGATFRFSLNG